MKKVLLFTTVCLMLLSSVVFCACDKKYDKLKIESNISEINLVLDGNDNARRQNIIFELSGAKSWGKVNIETKPSGLVRVIRSEVEDKLYGVEIEGLQPTGKGATLVFTHLASGKECVIPLNIGRRLQTVASAGNDFIIQRPVIKSGEKVEVEIPTRQLLDCYPSNYMDNIVWQKSSGEPVPGVNVTSYNKENQIVAPFVSGKSTAQKTLIVLDENVKVNTTFKIEPISVLEDGNATCYTDTSINVKIINVPTFENVLIVSPTHSERVDSGDPTASKLLKELVLISNPDKMVRTDSADGYNYYNTGLVELSMLDMPLGVSFAEMYSQLFNVEMSCDINDLLLETLEFGKYRVVASITSHGEGEIKIKFTPKNCVGDVKEFELAIPIIVGERATSMTATNNGLPVPILAEANGKDFTSRDVPLNDSSSYGQSFQFDVLSTNTLSGLRNYTITIKKQLLYINPDYIKNDGVTKTSRFILSRDGSEYNINDIVNSYEYQIALVKDGREITFYDDNDGNNTFTSEPITPQNTVYIKWVRVATGYVDSNQPFQITIKSKYNQMYDIESPYFDNLALTYTVAFNRQRTVASVEYGPVKVEKEGVMTDVQAGSGYSDDWQFYFLPDMITNNNEGERYTFYGIQITKLKGLNNAQLIGDEAKVDLNISIIGPNTGLGICEYVYDKDIGLFEFKNSCTLKYEDSKISYDNIIVFGVKAGKTINYGDWQLEISQVNRPIADKDIKVYKTLEENDINVSISDADYSGDLLRYEKLDAKPYDFEYNYSNYYENLAGRYVKVSNNVWNPMKTYYTTKVLNDVYKYVELSAKPDKFEENYSNYYLYNGSAEIYEQVTNSIWDSTQKYYSKQQVKEFIDTLIDVENAYILSASTATQAKYNVNLSISNNEYITIHSKKAVANFVDSYRLLEDGTNFDMDWTKYYMLKDGVYTQLSGTSSPGFVAGKYYENLSTLSESLLSGFVTITESKNEITTTNFGTFNTSTGEKNYIKITYEIQPVKYDYYKISDQLGETKTKSIYVYVYEPITSVTFDRTLLEKYDYYHQDSNGSTLLTSLREQYGTETLNIKINGESNSSVLNYVDILWITNLTGIDNVVKHDNNTSATYTFKAIKPALSDQKEGISGTIYALVNQFGAQYSIQCGYNVKIPNLTERIILNTPSQTFKSGGAYINMKLGETLPIDVTQHCSKGNVSMPGVQYVTCNIRGDKSNDIISFSDGQLTANAAGRAKLVIVSTDALTTELSASLKYLNLPTYVRGAALDCAMIIDIIVSDGSAENPYLIASAEDFKDIQADFVAGVNNKHYALTQNIDLMGEGITISGDFAGSFISYQEDEYSNNRFIVYGAMLNQSNPTLFEKLTASAKLENITFYIDIDYNASGRIGDTSIGLIGTNFGKIKNVTAIVSGKIYDTARAAADPSPDYSIGLLVANNKGMVEFDDITLVGVQGHVIVDLPNNSVMIGGLIGINSGTLIGMHTGAKQNQTTGNIEYETYYDNQGAVTDITLSVKAKQDNDSAVGGVIGYNKGKLNNVYSMGAIESSINNVGGLIGVNSKVDGAEIKSKFTILSDANLLGVGKVEFTTDASDFQINNCYSAATIVGCNNVGGVVGSDEGGSYYKVYYEIYSNNKVSITGNDQVGGLIGSAKNSNLYYCYVQNFAWDYSNNVDTFDIKANNTVGGLIGYAKSDSANYPNNNTENSPVRLNVVSCSASVNMEIAESSGVVSGLIAELDGYGAVYTAYYYGVIKASNGAFESTKFENGADIVGTTNLAYNNAYTIINGVYTEHYSKADDASDYKFKGFGTEPAYNNGNPYIVITQDGSNLVTIMPSSIEIDTAFEIEDANGKWIYEQYKDGITEFYIKLNNGWVIYDSANPTHTAKTRYAKIDDKYFEVEKQYVYLVDAWEEYDITNTSHDTLTPYNKLLGWTIYDAANFGHQKVARYNRNKVYEQYKYGEYALYSGSIVDYNPTIHTDAPRYTVRAELMDAEHSNDKSNYRKQAVVMYYYEFADTSGRYAIEDMYELNTISIRKIVGDSGIIVVPEEASKKFMLKSSDNGVVRILNGENLLLRSEGQAIITITSSINPSVSASFVVVVRTKVLDFNLYTSADLHNDNKITANTNINIVKGSSKLVETDFSYSINTYHGRTYKCVSATNIEIDFSINYVGPQTIADADIVNYITLNGVLNSDGTSYTIPSGQSIIISVDEHVNGKFVITATPYVISLYTYTDADGEQHIVKNRAQLPSSFVKSFNVVTKKGASAINVDRTQIDMMPSDQPSNLGLKISTDVKVDELKYQIVDITSETGTAGVDYINSLDIIFNNTLYTGTANGIINSIPDDTFDVDDKIQSLDLILRLNENSHYIYTTYTLQVRFYMENGTGKIVEEIIHINVLPQIITSIVPLNYRMEDRELQPGEPSISFDRAYESGVIRPGTTNIITIDIVPNIAIYDYVEVRDITTQDKILFMQVDENLKPLANMDAWINKGIKLKKLKNQTTNKDDSRLYLIAKLPENSTHNITHTIQITIYTKLGEPVIEYLNLEAIMYPTVVMKYSDPTGKQVAKADTRLGTNQIKSDTADLALGVEAPIYIETYNIDDDSLQYNIKITNAAGTEVNKDYVRLNYAYDRYVLYFNSSSILNRDELIGGKIEVSFTASKHLNGILETCCASIEFTIREFVIHSVSMTPSTIQNGEEKLYGDWSIRGNGNEIEDTEYWAYKEFCFDRTDISFYNNGYWNVKYTMANTQNLPEIKSILTKINQLENGTILYLNELTTNITTSVKSDSGYVGNGFEIKHETNALKIKAYNDSDINNIKLGVKFEYGYDASNKPVIPVPVDVDTQEISAEFGFVFTDKSTPFDEYLFVSTTEQFVNMIEGKYYQLTNDLVFEDEYTPLNTSISALNGNGYTITIKKFNTAQLVQDYIGGGMYIGLFGKVAEDTIIQNLQVDYNGVDGVIVSLIDNEMIQQQYSNEIFFGGITAVNEGAITNVKVTGSFTLLNNIVPSAQIDLGGITASNGLDDSTKVATITNSTSAINLQSIALIAGVAGVNRGKITNTIYTGNIISTSGNNAFASTVFTAGFVVENMAGSYISLSYVNNENKGDMINSVGNTAGFAYNNSGTINNSYIVNASIRSQGNIGGFVYQNSGVLDCCYSYVNIPSSLFYQEFIYVMSEVGEISNCYTITDSTRVVTILGLKSIKPADKADREKYQGFVLHDNKNGIWSMGAEFPCLDNAGFTLAEGNDYTNIYNIHDMETYQGYFKMFVDKDMSGKTFKIIRDIDFANAEFGNPITVSMELSTNLEGNDMQILNYNIYKENTVENIGLFASIEKDVYVRNLILKPESIKATSAYAVGALAGIIDSADVFNIKIDNDKLLILGKNAVGGLAGVVKGQFTISGITSNVSAFATYRYNTLSMYNLYTGKNVMGTETDNISQVSYVGSIAGIINGYNHTASFNAETRNTQNYYTASYLKVDGNLVLIGETVGALFGLVGEQTLVYNANYQLTKDTKYQAEFVAGGLVGENRGALQNCAISAQKIEGTNSYVDTSTCFNYNARVNGGIVGINIGGLVSRCSSSITIINNQPIVTVGGIVGRNIDGFVWECTVDGMLSGFYVGGIAGTDYSYSTIVKVKDGYGTATDTIVYKNISHLSSYNNENVAFKDNTLTRKYIQNFLNVSSQYYEFNSKHIDSSTTEPLVKTEKAFGLIIGLTDDTYNIIEGISSTDYSKITISKSTTDSVQTEYNLIYTVDQTAKQYTVEGYGNIIDAAFNLNGLYTSGSTPAVIAFLIAKEEVAYEGWSAVSGYGDKIVIISNKAIQSLTFKSANILQYEDNKYAIIVEGKLIAVNKLRYTIRTDDWAKILTTDGTGTLGFGYYTLDNENTPIVTLGNEGKKLYVIG